jgi:hypothetical protein
MEMSDNGNGNTRPSLLQGVFNEMVESGRHKRNARELLKQLDAWIADSIMRDDAFMDRLIRAIEDNAPHDQVDSTLMESDIQNIAQNYHALPANEPS